MNTVNDKTFTNQIICLALYWMSYFIKGKRIDPCYHYNHFPKNKARKKPQSFQKFNICIVTFTLSLLKQQNRQFSSKDQSDTPSGSKSVNNNSIKKLLYIKKTLQFAYSKSTFPIHYLFHNALATI